MQDPRSNVPLGVIGFNALYLLAAIVQAISSRNQEFVFYIIVMLILATVIIIVHVRVRLSQGVLWGLSVWGLAHMAGGLVPVPDHWPINGDIRVLYSWWLIPGTLKYDHLVHAFGFGVTTFVCWQGLRSIIEARTTADSLAPSPGMLVLCGAASMGFGALNELVEFIATITMPETNVGGYLNTGWDLVANLTGIFIATVLIRRAHRIAPESFR